MNRIGNEIGELGILIRMVVATGAKSNYGSRLFDEAQCEADFSVESAEGVRGDCCDGPLRVCTAYGEFILGNLSVSLAVDVSY